MADWFARFREWLELHLSWKSLAIAVVMVAVCAFFVGTIYQNWQEDHGGLTLVNEATVNDSGKVPASNAAAPTGEVKVHVVGEVTNPGVYTLPADARVDDAVRAAGATANADLSKLNLAQKLADGQKITVPAVGDAPAPSSPAAPNDSHTAVPDVLININTATADQLMTLPNIGEVRAQAIITYRENNNGFQSVDELKEVSGIGEKTFAQLQPYVTI